jgi:hypothetical protein
MYCSIFIVYDRGLDRWNLFRTSAPSLFWSADIFFRLGWCLFNFNDNLSVYFQFIDQAADPHFNYTFTFSYASHTKQLVLLDIIPSVLVNFFFI